MYHGMSWRHTMVAYNGHTIYEHVQTWSAMKNPGTIVNHFPGDRTAMGLEH